MTSVADPGSGSVRTIACPSCGGTLAIRAAGSTVSLGCQYCGALLDVAHPDVQLIAAWKGSTRGFAIPIGRRGTLFGTEWEVVGALARQSGADKWTEFLLFNPYAGYRWLVKSDGQWSFGTMLASVPEAAGRGAVRHDGKTYDHQGDSDGRIVTRRVVGEFYWRVRAGDTVDATSYSRGGTILSNEWTDDEASWTRLVPVPQQEIAAAFGLKSGPTPPAAGLPVHLLAMYVTGFAAFMLALFAGLMWLSPLRTAFEAQLLAASDSPGASSIIGSFNVAEPGQRVSVAVAGNPIDNGWVDIDVMLINRATQQARQASLLVEYYRGRDSDGPWTEGQLSHSADFSAVPAGTYDVLVEVDARRWNAPGGPPGAFDFPIPQPVPLVVPLGFRVSTGGVPWSNMLILLLLLMAAPALLHWRHARAHQMADAA